MSCLIPGRAQRTVDVVFPGWRGGGGGGGAALRVWARRLTVTHRSHNSNSSSGERPVDKPNTSTEGRTRVSGVKRDSG